jgi:PadR family transcriptional regulator, regulatory protein AphA
MPRSRLTSFEHVLLGMIFIQPSTGYDLKRRFATTAMGVYQPSSGALYPALGRLERRGLLSSEALRTAGGGRLRRLYHLTHDGRLAHLGWVRGPVVPETVSQDLGMHLLRLVMMPHVLPGDAVLGFLASLRTALAGFVASLEQQLTDTTDTGENPYAQLAVEHGLAVHRASLAWADQAITRLAAEASAAAPSPGAGPVSRAGSAGSPRTGRAARA